MQRDLFHHEERKKLSVKEYIKSMYEIELKQINK